MIIIEKRFGTIEDRQYSEPSRQLTAEEKSTVIAQWGDELNYWYFQKEDRENIIPEWVKYNKDVNEVNIDLDGDGIITVVEKKWYNPLTWFK